MPVGDLTPAGFSPLLISQSLSFLLVAIFLLSLPSFALASPPLIKVCANYGCKYKAEVQLGNEDWRRLQQLFASSASSPEQERQRIAEAIALMEALVGDKTGTAADQARNGATGEPGQLDCIAESLNTDRYLRLFEKQGWLRWHRVAERVKRTPWIFDVHWSALIEEKTSGQLFTVDSWFFANGRPPYIQPLADWKAKRDPN